MNESQISLPPFASLETLLLWLVLASSIVALGYGWLLRQRVVAKDPGPKSMVDVATAIQEGAMAYLRRQIRAMVPFVAIVTVGLYLLYRPIYAENPILAIGVAAAFLMGCIASYGAGFVGMTSAVRGNVRVANAARRSYREALSIAFQAGTISGMFTVGLGLLGATIIFMLFREHATRYACELAETLHHLRREARCGQFHRVILHTRGRQRTRYRRTVLRFRSQPRLC